MGDYFAFTKETVEALKDEAANQNPDEEAIVNTQKNENLSRHEKLYGQFKTISHFMENKSKSSDLLKYIFLYRGMNLVALWGAEIFQGFPVSLTSFLKDGTN